MSVSPMSDDYGNPTDEGLAGRAAKLAEDSVQLSPKKVTDT